MTHPLPIAATLRVLLLDGCEVARRSRESGNPAAFVVKLCRSQRHWIPAFAGMTHPLPIAATLRVLLLDGCVTSFSGRRPRYPICEMPRRRPWPPMSERADTAPAIPRIPGARTHELRPGFPSEPSIAEHFSPMDPDKNTPCRRSAPALAVGADTPSGPVRQPAFPAARLSEPPCNAHR